MWLFGNMLITFQSRLFGLNDPQRRCLHELALRSSKACASAPEFHCTSG
jgi:hypothetical protein